MRRFEKWMPVTAIVLAATIVLAIGTMGRKQVTVIDDDRKIVVSTVSSSMNAVFKAADIHLDPADVVTPPVDTKLTDGLEIQIVRADTHTIHVDETTSTVSTTHKSVEEIIHQANIDLSQSGYCLSKPEYYGFRSDQYRNCTRYGVHRRGNGSHSLQYGH